MPAIKQWFLKPWLLEKANPKHLAFVPSARPVQGKDRDAEVLRDSFLTVHESNCEGEIAPALNLEDEIEKDGLDDLTVLEEEARDALTNVMNDEEQQMNADDIPETVVPYIKSGGHRVFKSILVTQLNGNPFLSKDNLKKIRNSIFYNNSDDVLNATSSSTSCLLGIGLDSGVYFVQRSSTCISSTIKSAVHRSRKRKKQQPGYKGQPCRITNGVDEGSWWIGRVQKIRRRYGNKWGACKQPVDLLDRPANVQQKGTSTPSVMVLLTWYSKQPGRHKFKYDVSD